MQATALMSYITNDSQWGSWPNSYNGFIVLGVTVEASLDGLDVAAEVLDKTNRGLMICTTTSQEGNIALSLSNPQFDGETNTLLVDYYLCKYLLHNQDLLHILLHHSLHKKQVLHLISQLYEKDNLFDPKQIRGMRLLTLRSINVLAFSGIFHSGCKAKLSILLNFNFIGIVNPV